MIPTPNKKPAGTNAKPSSASTPASKITQQSSAPKVQKTNESVLSKVTGPLKTDTKKPVQVESSTEKIVTKKTNFLKGTEQKNEKETLYSNFFQKGKDGKITVGQKKSKSLLELSTQILGFLSPIVALITIAMLAHVLVRGQETSDFAENFPIFCGYLNSGLESGQDIDFGCNTIDMVQAEYTKKNQEQNTALIDILSLYIPIKVSENLLDASSEKQFIVDTFEKKSDINAIVQQFKKMTEYSQSTGGKHIICTGINIKNGDTLSTQCSIYGMNMGDETPLNSARIEALKFTEFLADTNRSQFVLTNSPTTLATEHYEPSDSEDDFYGFATRTSLPIAVKYVPFTSKN